MKLVLTAVAVSALLVGCASGPKWQHAQLSGADADRQYLIDNGVCTQQSYSAAPPRPPAQPPVVVVQQPNPYPNPYAQPQQAQPVQQVLPDYFGDGMRARAAGAADGARQAIYVGCMADRGWMRTKK